MFPGPVRRSGRSHFFVSLIVFSLLIAPLARAVENCPFGDLPPASPAREVSPVEESILQIVRDAHTLAGLRDVEDGRQRDEARRQYFLTTEPPTPFWKTALARIGLGVSALFGADLVLRFLENPNAITFAAATGAVAAGYALADWATAKLHFLSDNVWYNSRWSLLRNIARHGRVHHEVPNGVLEKTYTQRLGDDAPWAVPLLAAGGALLHSGAIGRLVDFALPGLGHVADVALGAFLGSFVFTAWNGAYSHQAAHDPNPNRLVRALQGLRILLPREQHLRHHRPPYEDVYSRYGFVERFLGVEYWRWQLRAYYDRTGLLPGTWVQDPRAIPADISGKLRAEYRQRVSSIPVDLWAYAPTVYPNRVPPELREPLAYVQQRWRAEFITARRAEYQELARTDPVEAELRWLEEQRVYDWIYGPLPHPLHPSPG